MSSPSEPVSRWASAPGRVGTEATLAESGALRHPAHRINVPAQFEENPTRAEFLREYGVRRLLKRLPTAQEPATKIADLCRRAVVLLPATPTCRSCDYASID